MINRVLFFVSAILLSNNISLSYVPCVQTDVTVEMKIHKYIAETKDALVGIEDATHLLGSVEKSTTSAALDKIKIFMSAAEEINISKSLITKDRMQVALLMQFSLPIIEQFKKELIHAITVLENSKKYWEFYRDHQPWYDQRNVMVSSLRQKKEAKINAKIKAIDSYLTNQFVHLGTLALHLDAFDESKQPDDQCVWLQQLGTIIISAYPGSHLMPAVASCNAVLKTLRIAAQCAMHYKATMQTEIRPYLMPSSIKRNWTALLVSAGALAYGSHYAYAKKHIMWQRAQQGSKSLSEYGKTQYNLAKEALFEGEISADKLKDEQAQLKEDYRKVLTRLHDSLMYQASIVQKKSENEVYVEHPVIKQLDPGKMQQFNTDVINQKACTLDLNYFDDTILPILAEASHAEGKEFSASLKVVAQKLATADVSLSTNVFGFAKKDNTTAIADIIHEVGKGPMDKIAALTDTVTKYSEVFVLYGRLQKFQGKQLLWELKKHNLINLAIVSAIPAAIVVWFGSKGLYWLYKKIRGVKVYDSIRDALVDTAMLLNTYGEAHPLAMLRQDYGRLLYLVHQLEQEQHNMPSACRIAFSNDVKLLQSSMLSAAQKLKVIDLIYKRYPFLLNDPRYMIMRTT